MKAVIYERYGPPEVLRVVERPTPLPKDDEIQIRVKAVEVTKSDCELRSFHFPVKWFWLPLRLGFGITGPRRQILGSYFAGTVTAKGANVTRFEIGDDIFGAAAFRLGAYGEYVCLPETYTLEHKPANLSFVEAAAIPLGGLNALHFVRKARLQSGDRLLINGAGGSIGTFALQIAKSMGVEVTVVDHGAKASMLKGLGADHFIDYTQQDFAQTGETYDAVLDMVASSSYTSAMQVLKAGGRYLMGNPRLSDMVRSKMASRKGSKIAIFEFAGEKPEELATLRDMAAQGQIRSAIDSVYPMDQIQEAHRRVQTEDRIGLIVMAADPVLPA